MEGEAEAYARGDEAACIEHSLRIHHTLAELSPNRELGSILTDPILRTSIVIALYRRDGLASCYLEGAPAAAGAFARRRGRGACQAVVDYLNQLEGLMDLGSRDASIDLMEILGGRRAG